jgi:membrane associated rhomboid family serine protease
MFRKTSGAILCPSCGRLTNADAPTCLVCGRRNPGMWGFAGPLRALFRRLSFVDVVTVACIALYVLSLIIDPRAPLGATGLMNLLPASNAALRDLGATGAGPWHAGQWWTLFTAIYLHGNVLHILFNVLWIRQLGPAVDELYGSSRLVVIFTVAGAVGFLASDLFVYNLTVGASGSIFGLLGALVAFGQKRGGAFGTMVLRQYGQWALVLFVFGFLMQAVNNVAHAGGFVGGYLTGWLLTYAEHRSETAFDHLLALASIAVTVTAFALAIWTAVA